MKKEEQKAESIIRQLREHGLSYGEMLTVIRLSIKKLENIKKIKR
jgi:hypothetical protein